VHEHGWAGGLKRNASDAFERDELQESACMLDAAIARDEAHADSWARRALVHLKANR